MYLSDTEAPGQKGVLLCLSVAFEPGLELAWSHQASQPDCESTITLPDWP
jgi:hypothetical protein